MRESPVLPSSANPMTTARMPDSARSIPTTTRLRSVDSGSATSSRSAATGAALEARRAGSTAATSVTTMPSR